MHENPTVKPTNALSGFVPSASAEGEELFTQQAFSHYSLREMIAAYLSTVRCVSQPTSLVSGCVISQASAVVGLAALDTQSTTPATTQ